MRFAVVSERLSPTNVRLVAAAPPGCEGVLVPPTQALRRLRPGDLALGRLDVKPALDGIEDGLWALELLAEAGVRVLNRPSALLCAHDKLLSARVLVSAGLPHPPTALVRCAADAAGLRFPVVLKPRFGSWGRDVVCCASHAELERALASFATRPWFRAAAIAQELVVPLGYDVRVVVAGGDVVGSIQRHAAPGEWRTNVALGGSRVQAPLDPAAAELALEAACAVGGDLVGVDLLPLRRGGFVVIEVNGAVDFSSEYRVDGDIFAAATGALASAARHGTARPVDVPVPA